MYLYKFVSTNGRPSFFLSLSLVIVPLLVLHFCGYQIMCIFWLMHNVNMDVFENRTRLLLLLIISMQFLISIIVAMQGNLDW